MKSVKSTIAVCITVLLILGGAEFLVYKEIDLQENIAISHAMEASARFNLDERKFQAEMLLRMHEQGLSLPSRPTDDSTPTPGPPSINLNAMHATPAPASTPDAS